MFERTLFRGGVDDLNWRGHDGSLGLEAARRLPCPRLATTAGSLGRQVSLAGASACSFAGDRPSIAENAQSRCLRVAASGLDRSVQDWRG